MSPGSRATRALNAASSPASGQPPSPFQAFRFTGSAAFPRAPGKSALSMQTRSYILHLTQHPVSCIANITMYSALQTAVPGKQWAHSLSRVLHCRDAVMFSIQTTFKGARQVPALQGKGQLQHVTKTATHLSVAGAAAVL